MPGLHLYKSNRLERLVDALAEVTRGPLRTPLEAERIIVPSIGMRRWLSLALAERQGVTMNTTFPFPADFARQVFSALLPETPPDPGFDLAVLRWRIFDALPPLLKRPEFADLRQYCIGENGPLKQYQLVSRIASVFDRYLAYRPQLLLDWQAGREAHWQAVLWRRLTKGRAASHAPALARQLAESLPFGPVDATALPPRVSVFGISSLPPLYIELLGAMAPLLEVHLFLLEPTADYWADLPSPRERASRRRALREFPEDEDFALTGNPLLGSLCKTGRDFEWLLLDRLEPHSEQELFVPPEEKTLLQQLQADIFLLRQPEERRAVEPDDRSVQIHCCHGPLRELEVLHDQLLDLFRQYPDLAPRDILVAMPDVETYAPLIDAVFGAPESEKLRIPYSVADRAARTESSVADTLLRILDLVGSRFPASSVLTLLDTPALRSRFQIVESDLPLIRAWIERSGIRWGIDAAHRETFGLPPFAENSWRTGLDRLLLGYALPGDDGTLFEGILPVREIEGSLAITLGQFVDFTDRLFQHTAELATARPLSAWEESLRSIIETFFDAGDDYADEIRRVSAALESLGEVAKVAEAKSPVEFAALRAHLVELLADTEAGPGFLAGRVTFCALKPMRSIPFRVLCLLGLDDGAFPRKDRPPGFDLTAQQPRRGDRTLRDDDRYLFLESILSARDTLYLSYAGLSVKDGSEAPPSTMVSELLDYLEKYYELPEKFVTRHRLQAFDGVYFTNQSPRLFSYSEDNAAASRLGENRQAGNVRFMPAAPLPEPGPEWAEVTLDRLVKFFHHPSKFLLAERLGVRLPEEEAPMPDSEPSSLDGLTRHQLRDRLTARSVSRGGLAADAAVARATGALPPGYAGDSAYGTIAEEVGELLDRLTPDLAGAILPALPLELQTGGLRLLGGLTDVRPQGLVRYRAGKLRPVDRVQTWLAHLALQCVAPDTHPKTTIFHALDATLRFRPVAHAPEILAAMLDLYARGLREPLRFFPNTSWEFAKQKLRPSKTSKKSPQQAAEQAWLGGSFSSGEADNPWYQLAWRGIDHPLDADFETIATAIFKPMFDAMEESE